MQTAARRASSKLLWCTSLLPLLAAGPQLPAASAPRALRPLQTELIAPLDLSRVRVDSPVLVRMDLAWTGPECVLNAGSLVQGRVVAFTRRSKAQKDSQMEVIFDHADCHGELHAARAFTLVALVGATATGGAVDQFGVREAPPLADAPGLAISGGIRSAQAASAINDTRILPARSLPSQITPGQVVDIRRVKLSVGTGQGDATVITATNHDLRLERGTSLILVATAARPDVGAGAGTPAGYLPGSPNTAAGIASPALPGKEVAAGASPPAAAPVPEPPDETDICSGVCNTVDALEAGSGVSASAARLPIHDLGYAPHEKREVASFDDDTTLTYLDAKTLLCTFDPHQLRRRTEAGQDVSRQVRAVLIDPATHNVRRVVSWRIRGSGQYLWKLAGGRVLVHIGRQLRLLDSDLHEVKSIPVDGRVAWVVSSPSGDHMAVGTVDASYSAYVYRERLENISEDPEQEVTVRLFDGSFTPLLTTTRSSRSAPPVLSDFGELRVHPMGHNRWRLTEYGWDRTEKDVAVTRSACRPVLSSPEHGLIFAVGCTGNGDRWYRVLRGDGHPLLKGLSPSDEIQQAAAAVSAGEFAVRIVKTVRPWTDGQPFTRGDLAKEEIAVYRSSDGKTLAAVTSDDFTLSQHSFAISPGGSEMALAGSNAILFYPISPSRR